MKPLRFLIVLAGWLTLTSATPEEACSNTEAMIRFVEKQTEQALEQEDMSLIRYHAFKALNAIERTRNQLQDCGCDYTRKNLFESLENLKLATQVTTLEGTRIPLSRAMDYIHAGKEALKVHDETHGRPFGQQLMTSGNGMPSQTQAKRLIEEEKALEAKIEKALINYRSSLEEVVNGVPCEEALVFVNRIYAHCEKQLEKGDLTPAKKYYNLRTKEITENALYRLKGCSR
ncbi:MAG: hypothetical protein P8X60_06830 [Robiginitalea sp.]